MTQLVLLQYTYISYLDLVDFKVIHKKIPKRFEIFRLQFVGVAL